MPKTLPLSRPAASRDGIFAAIAAPSPFFAVFDVYVKDKTGKLFNNDDDDD
ncbi:MAG: hypothetical protein ABI680_15925 [Chthoniobacteraceae bacterium]